MYKLISHKHTRTHAPPSSPPPPPTHARTYAQSHAHTSTHTVIIIMVSLIMGVGGGGGGATIIYIYVDNDITPEIPWTISCLIWRSNKSWPRIFNQVKISFRFRPQWRELTHSEPLLGGAIYKADVKSVSNITIILIDCFRNAYKDITICSF